MQKNFVLIFYCTFHEILLLLIVKGGAINFDALHQLLYLLKFEFTNGYEMMHKAWSTIEEVPYCFARSSVKFQRRTALKIVKFDPDWAFPDCNSSLNSPMAMKWCRKLEVA